MFVQRQLWLRNNSLMVVRFPTNYSYNGFHIKKYGVRKWRRSRLWNPRWSAELPLLRNIFDYPDALLEMNNLFKRTLQQNMLIVSSEKGPTYEPRSKLQRQFGRLHVYLFIYLFIKTLFVIINTKRLPSGRNWIPM